MCWKHLLTARIPGVSVERQRAVEPLERLLLDSLVPAASVRQSRPRWT